MLHIDGGAKSGSGTLLRYAVAFASLLGQDLHMTGIRAGRDKPGLRPQHLASVMACARLCGAAVTGAEVNSREIYYRPGGQIKGGNYRWEIGTAGSTTLLAMTLLPIALFADSQSVFRLTGGLFQDFAPSAHHMQQVFLPALRKMGADTGLEVLRPGYVPRGGGVIELTVKPVAGTLMPRQMLRQGRVVRVSGIALSSHLREKKVSQRMAEECRRILAGEGYPATIETQWDDTAAQAGASLAVWAETDTGCRLGADRAGKMGRSSEEIGRYVARSLLEDLKTGATADRHLADQLVLYAALAGGASEFVIPRLTEHVETNLWLVEQFGAGTEVRDNLVHIEGTGFKRE